MTATTGSGRRTGPTRRADTLALVAAVLLVLAALAAVPTYLFDVAFYAAHHPQVALAAAIASAPATLVLAAAAAARGSRTLLLVASVVSVLHLASLILLETPAVLATDEAQRTLPEVVQLALALVGLALAWTHRVRAVRHPLVALLPVVLAPMAGVLVSMALLPGPGWEIGLLPLFAVTRTPMFLVLLAAALVCLSGRGARIAGAVVAGGAILGTLWSDRLLEPVLQSSPLLRIAPIGAAVVCAVVAAVLTRRTGPDDGTPDHDTVPDDAPPGAAEDDRDAPVDVDVIVTTDADLRRGKRSRPARSD